MYPRHRSWNAVLRFAELASLLIPFAAWFLLEAPVSFSQNTRS
jgi:hypothetical protein